MFLLVILLFCPLDWVLRVFKTFFVMLTKAWGCVSSGTLVEVSVSWDFWGVVCYHLAKFKTHIPTNFVYVPCNAYVKDNTFLSLLSCYNLITKPVKYTKGNWQSSSLRNVDAAVSQIEGNNSIISQIVFIYNARLS